MTCRALLPAKPVRVLLMACSATKIPGGRRPAVDVYDGPAYRVLRGYLRTQHSAAEELRVVILSARYGLIRGETPIEVYEQRMTRERAEGFLLFSELEKLRAELAPIVAGAEATLIMGGLLYRTVLASIARGQVKPAFALGGIGDQLGQLKAWLYRRAPAVVS